MLSSSTTQSASQPSSTALQRRWRLVRLHRPLPDQEQHTFEPAHVLVVVRYRMSLHTHTPIYDICRNEVPITHHTVRQVPSNREATSPHDQPGRGWAITVVQSPSTTAFLERPRIAHVRVSSIVSRTMAEMGYMRMSFLHSVVQVTNSMHEWHHEGWSQDCSKH